MESQTDQTPLNPDRVPAFTSLIVSNEGVTCMSCIAVCLREKSRTVSSRRHGDGHCIHAPNSPVRFVNSVNSVKLAVKRRLTFLNSDLNGAIAVSYTH